MHLLDLGKKRFSRLVLPLLTSHENACNFLFLHNNKCINLARGFVDYNQKYVNDNFRAVLRIF
jgi:hypothetical protein